MYTLHKYRLEYKKVTAGYGMVTFSHLSPPWSCAGGGQVMK